MRYCVIKSNDASLVVDYFQRNRDYLQPWSPLYDESFHSLSAWEARLSNSAQPPNTVYFMTADAEKMLAYLSLSNIVYGAFQACYMGYSVDREYQGRGLVSSLGKCAIDHAFNQLGLHRIMANYMPRNERSARVLRRLGFVEEGRAKDYLKINGRWEDHVLTSLTNKEV